MSVVIGGVIKSSENEAQSFDIGVVNDNDNTIIDVLARDIKQTVEHITEAVSKYADMNGNNDEEMKTVLEGNYTTSCMLEYRGSGVGKVKPAFNHADSDISYDSESSCESDGSFNDAIQVLEHNGYYSDSGEKPRESLNGNKASTRAKGEIFPEELPAIEQLKITVDEDVELVEFGVVTGIVDTLVVIKAALGMPALNEETILFTKGRVSLGTIFEIFGPVAEPSYVVRFNSGEQIHADQIEVGMTVFCAPKEEDYTNFVFVSQLEKMRGSDASWVGNIEPPVESVEYSDDEQEKLAKAKRRLEKGLPEKKKSRNSRKTGARTTRTDQCFPPDCPPPRAPPHRFHQNQQPRQPFIRGPPMNSWPPPTTPSNRFNQRPNPNAGSFLPPSEQSRFDGPPPTHANYDPNVSQRPRFDSSDRGESYENHNGSFTGFGNQNTMQNFNQQRGPWQTPPDNFNQSNFGGQTRPHFDMRHNESRIQRPPPPHHPYYGPQHGPDYGPIPHGSQMPNGQPIHMDGGPPQQYPRPIMEPSTPAEYPGQRNSPHFMQRPPLMDTRFVNSDARPGFGPPMFGQNPQIN